MEQETNGRPLVKCEQCVFCSTHRYGWKFCLALAELLRENQEPPCAAEYFKEDDGTDRYEQLVEGFRGLDE